MTDLAVVTPSFAPDAPLFADLHESVLSHTPPETVHHVVVPPEHQDVFAGFAGPRCRVWTESELLPRRFVRVRCRGLWVNTRRPWPPVRGWVMQQALKFAVAAALDTRAVLVADSDVVLVRPTTVDRFTESGSLRLYRREGAVHAGMERHVRWHSVARRLLGLPAAPPPPLHDYVSSLNLWDPAVVAAMQARITESTRRNWLDAFVSQLHISEFILYGVFVDEILHAGGPPAPGDSTICHDYWDTVSLDRDAAVAFGRRIPAEAVAMMISSKSRTPRAVRLAAHAQCGPHAEHRSEGS